MSMQFITMGKINPENFILILAAMCLLLMGGAKGGGRALTDLKIRRQLKHLNKPAVKSIKVINSGFNILGNKGLLSWWQLRLSHGCQGIEHLTGDGNIIDCVDIYKQPAFDHPLLKNHTIQMTPTNYESEKKASSKPIEQLWQWSESCPEGTIPIRRTRKSDLLKKISLDETTTSPAMENAELYVEDDNIGGHARIEAWNVHVENGESSSASLVVGVKDHPDTISAGWIVSGNLYEDNKTHAHIYWASENEGCYNLVCPGFIQTYKDFIQGVELYPLSVYGGDLFTITVKLYKDKAVDHWWFEFNHVPIGYWPGSLFKNMAQKANLIQWGGQVWNSFPQGRHTSTQMGSGHYPIEGIRKAASMDECFYNNFANEFVTPSNAPTRASKPTCYDISNSFKSEAQGVGFFFGGPGGVNCDARM